MRADPQSEDYPLDSESTLSRTARQSFGVELSIDPNDDRKQPTPRPSGRALFREEVIPNSWTVIVWILLP